MIRSGFSWGLILAVAGQIKGFGQILAGDARYKVPEFQRNFAWGEDEIEPLLDDLKEIVVGGGKHFIGSLIVLNDDQEQDQLLVIDGQQRLTSLFIVLAAIRDYLDLQISDPTLKIDDDDSINLKREVNNLLFHIDPQSKAKKPRLVAHPRIQVAFESTIINAPAPNRPQITPADGKDKEPLRKVRTSVKSWLQENYSGELDEQEKLKSLHSLIHAINTQLTVLTITADDITESYDVFMSLNSTGKPLEQADLIKSELFRILTKGLEPVQRGIKSAELETAWSAIIQNLGKTSTDEFLRHFFVSTTNKKVRKQDIFKAFYYKFKSVRNDESAEKALAEEILNEIIEASFVYGSLIEAKASPNPDLNEHLRFLQMWGTVVTRVFLLAVFDKSLSVSEQDQMKHVKLLETFTVRWNLTGGNAQEFESLLQESALNLRSGEKNFDQVVEKMKIKMPTDDLFKNSFHNTATKKRASLILAKLDAEAMQSGIAVDMSLYTLDYVAPVSQNDEWRAVLFPQEQANIDQEYRASVEKWGNLVLFRKTDTPPSAGLSFDLKKVSTNEHLGYGDSEIELTRSVAEKNDWTRSEISHRARELGELAVETWNY